MGGTLRKHSLKGCRVGKEVNSETRKKARQLKSVASRDGERTIKGHHHRSACKTQRGLAVKKNEYPQNGLKLGGNEPNDPGVQGRIKTYAMGVKCDDP